MSKNVNYSLADFEATVRKIVLDAEVCISGETPLPNLVSLFELGVQRLETLEELEIQYSQALTKLERETIY